MAQLMPLPLTVSCFSKIQIGFTFLVPADPCSPGQRVVKRVCVRVLSGGSMKLNVLRLTHAIPSQGYNRYAVASLGDKVFVAGEGGIDVYNATTFDLQHNLTLHRLSEYCYGLAACSSSNCLYASDWQNSRIHRVDPSGSSAVKQWSVASRPRGLSVNKEHNVVVACYGAHKLQEYTTHGTLVREISLQQVGLSDLWHAVQLSTGDYVVSHYTLPGAVSVVGVDGNVVCRYHPTQTSNVGQMQLPGSLAVTKNGDVLVADDDNERIVSMDSSLRYAEVLALPVEIHYACSLCLDESRGRLYVSEHNQGRVLVFECTTA